MKSNPINEEEITEINSLNFEGNNMGFDNSTSPDSFIGIKEDL